MEVRKDFIYERFMFISFPPKVLLNRTPTYDEG